MILPLRQYNQCSCWTSWILNIATWSHICPGQTIPPMTHLLYVRCVGQDHQSILDDLSGWPVRTLVKYLLCVHCNGQDHQSILDDLSGWPVRTQVKYLLCPPRRSGPPIDIGWPVRLTSEDTSWIFVICPPDWTGPPINIGWPVRLTREDTKLLF